MWTKPRHRLFAIFIRPFIYLLCKIKCNYSYEKFKLTKGNPKLILSNHVTAYDQFFVGLASNRHLYYLVTNVAFSPFISKLLKYLIGPIEKVKGKRDSACIRNIIKVVREGESIWLAPEGNRTLDGQTTHIDFSITKLVRMLKIPVIFYIFSGGYGVQPRWANKLRKGEIKGFVRKEISYDEYSALSDQELYELICQNLYYKEQVHNRKYYGKGLAEGMEKLVYVCPNCKSITKFSSKNDTITCRECGFSLKYKPDLSFESHNKSLLYFNNTCDWYAYQRAYIHSFPINTFDEDTMLFSDDGVHLFNNSFNDKTPITKGKIEMYPNRIKFISADIVIDYVFDNIDSMCCSTVKALDKLAIFGSEGNFLIVPPKNVNTFKYLHLFYHYKNIQLNDVRDAETEFLGV